MMFECSCIARRRLGWSLMQSRALSSRENAVKGRPWTGKKVGRSSSTENRNGRAFPKSTGVNRSRDNVKRGLPRPPQQPPAKEVILTDVSSDGTITKRRTKERLPRMQSSLFADREYKNEEREPERRGRRRPQDEWDSGGGSGIVKRNVLQRGTVGARGMNYEEPERTAGPQKMNIRPQFVSRDRDPRDKGYFRPLSRGKNKFNDAYVDDYMEDGEDRQLLPKQGRRAGIANADRALGRGKGWARFQLVERLRALAAEGELGTMVQELRDFSLGRTLLMYNTALLALSAAKEWKRAVGLFVLMTEEKEVKPNHLAYTLAIRAVSKGGNWRRAVQLHDDMIKSGVKPTLRSYTAALQACYEEGGGAGADIAIRLLTDMKKDGLEPDDHAYVAAITGIAAGGKWQEAINVLKQMPTVSLHAYAAAMNACAKAKQWAKAMELLTELKEKCDNIDQRCYTACMLACSRCGRWEEALSLMSEIESKGWVPSHYARCAAMDACGKAGEWQKVLDMLVQWERKSVTDAHADDTQTHEGQYTAATPYGIAVSACNRAGKWQKALSVLDMMKAANVKPTVVVYSATLQALGAPGQWETALDIWDEMLEAGIQPNEFTRAAMINVLKAGGRDAEHVLTAFLSGEEGRDMPRKLQSVEVSE